MTHNRMARRTRTAIALCATMISGAATTSYTASSQAQVAPVLATRVAHVVATGAAHPAGSGAAVPLPDGGVFPPGRYVTALRPGLGMTVPFPGWEVDVNIPGWVGLEFPLPDHVLATFNIIRVDKIFDPANPGRLIDPPTDLARFISHLPGLTVVSAPRRVSVGGFTGRQLDVFVGPDDVQLGPIPGVDDVQNGFGAGGKNRIIVVRVGGHQVEFTVGPGEVTPVHFDDAVKQAGKVIRSVKWHGGSGRGTR